MTVERIGELAALGTSLLWTLTYVQFTIAVRVIGSGRLNRLRLLSAILLLLAAHAIVYRTPIPLDAEAARWGWLALSGVIGFAISDALLFSALLRLGAHRTSLVMALIPVVSALLAWALFGERLSAIQIVAALVTVAGIALVVSARSAGPEKERSRLAVTGILFALGAVCAQSLRYILSVQGMRGGYPVLSTNVIQILAATVAAWIPAFVSGAWRSTFSAPFTRRAAVATIGGATTGPVLGVTMSLIALSRAQVGIASTLMALSPVFLLPLSRFVFKEPVGVRAAAGTAFAVGGVAVLLLTGSS
jgi:drug/metabolite transporter (DMT)-like permease